MSRSANRTTGRLTHTFIQLGTRKDEGPMKQGIPSRRTRGRGNPRGRQQNNNNNIRNQQMDSNGPIGRLRGTPQQIFDRYSSLARDASSAGDTVLAENLWQHAEHFVRMLNVAQQPNPNQPQQGSNGPRQGGGRDDELDFNEQDGNSQDSGRGQDNGRGQDSGRDQDNGRGQDEDRAIPAEPLVLKANPEPVPPLDLGNQDQPPEKPQPEPEPQKVWSEADVNAATEEAADADPKPPPRRRRRTRFPRQTEGNEAAGSDTAAAAPPLLKLPDDPSPTALVDLLTRAEEADRQKPHPAEDDND